MKDHSMNDIQKMIAKGECSKLEFKESFPKDHDKWLKTAVAFANGSGGTILIGFPITDPLWG